MKMDWRIVVAAIGAIMIMQLFALYQGINGMMLTATIAIIAAIAGVAIPTPKLFLKP